MKKILFIFVLFFNLSFSQTPLLSTVRIFPQNAGSVQKYDLQYFKNYTFKLGIFESSYVKKYDLKTSDIGFFSSPNFSIGEDFYIVNSLYLNNDSVKASINLNRNIEYHLRENCVITTPLNNTSLLIYYSK